VTPAARRSSIHRTATAGRRPLLRLLLLALTLPLTAAPRTWKEPEGVRTFQGEFISRDAKGVTIRRSDGRQFTLANDRLHPDDAKWLDATHPLPGGKPAATPNDPNPIFEPPHFGAPPQGRPSHCLGSSRGWGNPVLAPGGPGGSGKPSRRGAITRGVSGRMRVLVRFSSAGVVRVAAGWRLATGGSSAGSYGTQTYGMAALGGGYESYVMVANSGTVYASGYDGATGILAENNGKYAGSTDVFNTGHVYAYAHGGDTGDVGEPRARPVERPEAGDQTKNARSSDEEARARREELCRVRDHEATFATKILGALEPGGGGSSCTCTRSGPSVPGWKPRGTSRPAGVRS